MQQNIEDIRENIAFMRRVVLEARETALGDGFAFIAAGAIYGIAGCAAFATAYWGVMLRGGGQTIFSIATMLFVAATLVNRARGRTGVPGTSAVAKIARLARLGMAGALLTLLAAFAVFDGGRASALVPMMPVIVFSLYGAAWMAASGLTTLAWPRWVAILSYAAALGLAVLGHSKWQLLGFGIAMLCLALLPGLAVRRLTNQSWPN